METIINNNYNKKRNIGIYYSEWTIYHCDYNNKFNMLENLITYLKNKSNFIINNFENIISDKINIILRCDIDCDIKTAIKMAKYFNKEKIYSYFFLLHTSLYYRQNRKYPICRCEDLQQNILKISGKFNTVGLHIDPLDVYINLDHGDGQTEVINEINYLNKILGYNIKYICAHNSAIVYGAENFEIFKELTNRKYFTYKENKIPLGTLSLKELNLKELNFPKIKIKNNNIELLTDKWDKNKIFKKSVHNNDVFQHNYNINIWCIGEDKWIISNHYNNYFDIVTYDKIIEYLDKLQNTKENNVIVFNLHPIYFSK